MSSGGMRIQLAIYARVVDPPTFYYGYFGMQHVPKEKKDDAAFMDNSGKGVSKFDKFVKSLKMDRHDFRKDRKSPPLSN